MAGLSMIVLPNGDDRMVDEFVGGPCRMKEISTASQSMQAMLWSRQCFHGVSQRQHR